jgi:hypothetical protein
VRLARPVLIALLLVGAALISFKVARVVLLARELNTAGKSLRREALALQDAEDLTASVETIRADLAYARTLAADLRRAIWPLGGLLKTLDWVPVYGDDLAAAPYVLDLLDALLTSAHHLDTAFGPLLENIDTGQVSDQGMLVDVLEAVEAADQPLADARRELDAARRARQHITNVQNLSPPLRDAIADADRLIDALDQTLTAIEALPSLLGTEKPHHILILLQNADEMRPTGGFITSSVYLVIDRGRVVEVTTINSNSPEIDRFEELLYEEPPAPLRDYMYLPIWAFRDANWSPDFPTSATKAAELYMLGRQVPVDTVVAITQYTIRDLVAVTGEIPLADGTVIQADNVVSLFQDLWTEYSSERGYEARKDFIPELAPLLLDNFLNIGNVRDALDRWRVARVMAERGDLLVYSTNPSIQAMAERSGWDGSIPIRQGDYLYVVDANVGVNKTDLKVERYVAYHISLTTLAMPYSMLELEYRNLSEGQGSRAWACPGVTSGGHTGYLEGAEDCYADFLRLYLPEGAEMLQAPQFALPEIYPHAASDPAAGQVRALFDERSKEVYGGLMVVSPGTSTTAPFTYRLPPAEILALRPDGTIVYDLTIQKQPGVRGYPVSITVDLPPDTGLVSVTPEPNYWDSGTLYFEARLNADLRLQVVMLVPEDIQQEVAAHLLPSGFAPEATSTPRLVPTQPPLPTRMSPVSTPPAPTPTE